MPEATLQAALPAPDYPHRRRDSVPRQHPPVRRRKVRPLVKEMDEKGVFEQDLIHEFFQLGLMGIEIPEQYGGGGGKFFEAILAVEELSRVDASAGVIVDVQNTLVNNALLRWDNRRAEEALPAQDGHRTCRRLRAQRSRFRFGRLRAADPRRAQRQRVRPQRPQALDHQRQGSRPLYSLRHGRSRAGYKGITAFHDREGFSRIHRRQERRQARHPRLRPPAS